MNVEDVTLPELADDRVDEMEKALFAAIAAERGAPAERHAVDARRRARRGRWWVGAAAAAAVVIVAAVVGPQLGGLGGIGASSTADEAGAPEVWNGGSEDGRLSGVDAGAAAENGAASEDGAQADGSLAREIIATASASVQVEDAATAAREIGEAAERAGGYVETLSLAGEGQPAPGVIRDGGDVWPSPSGSWITVRVPADELTAQTRGLAEVGEVMASQLERRDVTTQVVDLRARIEALEASVTRLTALMAEATSTADLLSAESALAQRQAELESYQQQLTALDDQVAMSTLTVTLSEPQEVVKADPAGFGDGLAAGWNGLVATVNGIVIGLGFLLPWLVVLAGAALVVWAVRAARRRRTAAARASATTPPEA